MVITMSLFSKSYRKGRRWSTGMKDIDIWWRWLSFVSDNSLNLLNLSSSGWHLEWHYQFHHSLLVHELLHCWPPWHNFLTLQTSLLVDALLTKTKSCRLQVPGNFECFNWFVLQSWTISTVTFTCGAITCFISSVQNTLERLYDWVILEKMRSGENLVCPAIRKEIRNSNFCWLIVSNVQAMMY